MKDLKQQLVEAGLVSEEDARRATHVERVSSKPRKPADREKQAEATRQQHKKEQAVQRDSDRHREEERKATRSQKEAGQQARQKRDSAVAKSTRDGGLENWEGRRTYHFQVGKRIESLRVNDEAARRLEQGKAAIVGREDGKRGYSIITSGAASRMEDSAADLIVCWHRTP